MLLTISTSHSPAQDLGYLLHKHPDQVQSFTLTFGQAHVFYPLVGPETTMALLLEIDSVDLVRGRRGNKNQGQPLEQYVNDRPYVASSFLSVAIAEVLGTALSGKCKEREALAATAIPLTARITCLPAPGEDFLCRLFEPLGYEVTCETQLLDEQFPEWGSRYYTVSLKRTCRLQELLQHIYVLVPVLDNNKHYYVGEDEVDKLMRHAGQWLSAHPERDMIARRYLRNNFSLARQALERLADVIGEDDEEHEENEEHDKENDEAVRAATETALESSLSLNEIRLDKVLSVLKESGCRSVIDLGCGEGRLLKMLARDNFFKKLCGMDVSYRALEAAKRRLRLDDIIELRTGREREAADQSRISLCQGSLTYRDKRMQGYDAATLIEVIEHLDEPRLEALERVVFQHARPKVVLITTPNVEYNKKFTGMTSTFRHKDHRFEWTRREFRDWAEGLAARRGYRVVFEDIGVIDETLGAPTQAGVFTCL